MAALESGKPAGDFLIGFYKSHKGNLVLRTVDSALFTKKVEKLDKPIRDYSTGGKDEQVSEKVKPKKKPRKKPKAAPEKVEDPERDFKNMSFGYN